MQALQPKCCVKPPPASKHLIWIQMPRSSMCIISLPYHQNNNKEKKEKRRCLFLSKTAGILERFQIDMTTFTPANRSWLWNISESENRQVNFWPSKEVLSRTRQINNYQTGTQNRENKAQENAIFSQSLVKPRQNSNKKSQEGKRLWVYQIPDTKQILKNLRLHNLIAFSARAGLYFYIGKGVI